jgi:hypothetical protein
MKTLFTIALAAAVTYAVLKVLEHDAKGSAQSGAQSGVDAANPPTSVDDIPTLKGVRDPDLDVAPGVAL